MYYIFIFLIFNIEVRLKNRCISILNVTRKNFFDVECIVQSLSPERLKIAKVELKASGKMADEGVN